MSLPRTYRTIRRLTVQQQKARLFRILRYRLFYPIFGPRVKSLPKKVPTLRGITGQYPFAPKQDWQRYFGRRPKALARITRQADKLKTLEMGLLNRQIHFEASIDWKPEQIQDPLWHYSLHYFEWAWPLIQAYLGTGERTYLRTWVQSALNWIEDNPPGVGVGWQPYPLSRRLIAWGKVCGLLQHDELFQSQIDQRFWAAIRQQTLLLEENLETDLFNNHLIANAAALAWVGTLFSDWPDSERWRRDGYQLLWSELLRQVGPDGLHTERSTSYQMVVLKDGLEAFLLAQANDVAVPAEVITTLKQMAECLIVLLRPDGRLPLLSDAVRDYPLDERALLAVAALIWRRGDFKSVAGYHSEEYLFALFGQQGLDQYQQLESVQPQGESAVLLQGGYAVFRSGWQRHDKYLVFDVGPLGPDWSPGHGHADALSFELYAGATPLIIDPGTYSYHSRQWRDYFRGTRAHNTVVVDGWDQSELWKSFRVGSMATCTVLGWSNSSTEAVIRAEHDGYTRLKQPVVHRRTFRYLKPDRWIIEDLIQGEGEHTYEVLFHLAPDLKAVIKEKGGRCLVIKKDDSVVLKLDAQVPAQTTVKIKNGWVSEGWNQKEQSLLLCYSVAGSPPLKWSFELQILS